MAESSPVCKKRRYDAAFKLKVIEFAEQNTNMSAARKYGIDEKLVCEWKKQEDRLGILNSNKRILDGGRCKAALPDNGGVGGMDRITDTSELVCHLQQYPEQGS